MPTPAPSTNAGARNAAADSILAAFGAADDPQVDVLTRFMETMEPVQPVSPGTSFRPFLNASGLLDIYSVGTGSELFRLRRQRDGDAAYAVRDLDIVARMPSLFNGSAGPDNPDIMGVDLEGRLTLSTWDAPKDAYRQRVEQPVDAQGKLGQFLGTKVNDIIYANVLLEDSTVGSNFLEGGEWASKRWVPVLRPDGEGEAKALSLAMCRNNPLQNALYAISEERSVWFAESRNAFTRFQDLGFLTVDDITVLEDGEGRLNIFAIGRRASRPGDSTSVWVKRENRFSEPGHIRWDEWEEIASGVELRELRATVESSGATSVFGIEDDAEGRLFILREQRDRRGRRTGWGDLVPLGNPVPGQLFEIAQDENGLAEAYTVVQGAAVARDQAAQALETVMVRFWQDPQTTQWFSEPVRVEESTEAVSLPSYAIEMQVKDGEGTPVPFADLTLTSSVLATLRVNGRAFPVSRLRPLQVQTDASGRAVVYYVTGSLSTPSLGVELEGTTGDQGLTIEPNARLQDRLNRLTTEEVLDAKDASGNPLLKGSESERLQNAEAIAGISQRAMSIGKPAPSLRSARATPFLKLNPSQTGLRHHHHFSAKNPFKLRAEDVPEQHWRVRFEDDGRVKYEDLDRSQAAAYTLSLRSSSELGGFLGIEWGDIWQSIKTGVGKIFEGIKEFVVTTIIDPITRLVKEIKVVFQLVIDGVKFLIDKTIEFVQQAFDIIEGVWNKVKVFFEELFEWLAFLFNLADIRRTADVVVHSVNVSMDFAVIAIDNIKETVVSGFDSLEERIKSSVDQFVGSLAPNESYRQFLDKEQNPDGRAQTRDTDGHNVVLNAFQDNYTGAEGLESAEFFAEQDDAVQRVIDRLLEIGDNFEFGEGEKAFNEGIDYFVRIGGDGGNAVNLAFAGMIKLMESLALTGLAITRGVILTILDLVAALLLAVRAAANSRFEIPILSPIYKFFTGRELSFSMLDVTALIVAIPANIAYKIANDAAPFPDSASVERFRRDVTAKRLAQLAGFKVNGRQLAKVSRRAVAAVTSWAPVLGWILGGVFIVRAITEPVANLLTGARQAMPQDKETPVNPLPAGKLHNLVGKFSGFSDFAHRTFGLANVVLRAATSLFTAPWLLDSEAGAPACNTAKGYSQIVWITQATFGPFLGFIFWIGGLFTPKAAMANLFRLTIWGVVHCVLVLIQWAVGGFANGFLIARAILGTLAPQATWFLLFKKVIVGTKGISLVGQAAFSSITMVANAVLTFIATAKLEDDSTAVRRPHRLPRHAFAAAAG
ncbi:MAG: hypothetical protein AAGM22_03725 [Acidobacteriota bacterium]